MQSESMGRQFVTGLSQFVAWHCPTCGFTAVCRVTLRGRHRGPGDRPLFPYPGNTAAKYLYEYVCGHPCCSAGYLTGKGEYDHATPCPHTTVPDGAASAALCRGRMETPERRVTPGFGLPPRPAGRTVTHSCPLAIHVRR